MHNLFTLFKVCLIAPSYKSWSTVIFTQQTPTLIVAWNKNKMKYLWFYIPTQFPIQGQWWSILCMHLLLNNKSITFIFATKINRIIIGMWYKNWNIKNKRISHYYLLQSLQWWVRGGFIRSHFVQKLTY